MVLHSHWVSSYQTDFLQTDAKAETEESEGKDLQLNTLLFWQATCFPPKLSCKKKTTQDNIVLQQVCVFTSHPRITVRGERESKETVTHTGYSIHFNAI